MGWAMIGLVSILGLGPRRVLQIIGSGVPSSIPSSGKNFFFCLLQHPRRFWIPLLNKGGPHIEVPSLWGTWEQAESLLMAHSEKCRVKDSIGRFLHTPWPLTLDPGQVKKENWYYTQIDCRHSAISRTLNRTEDLAFSVTAPILWNTFNQDLLNAKTLYNFKTPLRNYPIPKI